jgi:hypothetical protein
MKLTFLILPLILCLAPTLRAQRQTIEQAEYFLLADPGEGNGIALTIQGGNAQDSLSKPLIASHPISYGGLAYVRVKSSGFIDINGKTIAGVWSLPTAVVFPTTAVLISAQAKIIRPKLSYPLFTTVFAVSGKFDSVVQQVRCKIPVDSLKVGDTLEVRLQGKDELWGDWALIPITQGMFAGVANGAVTAGDNLKCYPNPVSNSATISYTLSEGGSVSMILIDALGKKVYTSYSNYMEAGVHTITLDVTKFSRGIYSLRIISGAVNESLKMMKVQ